MIKGADTKPRRRGHEAHGGKFPLRRKTSVPPGNAGPKAKRRFIIVDARTAALEVLNALEKKNWTLDAALARFTNRYRLSAQDQALFHALLHGVLRWRGAMDPVIAHFSHRPLARIDPEILNILRMGLFQIRYLDKIPVSAAVNTAVEMTRKMAKPWAAGYVNALLRSAAAVPPEALLPDPNRNPVDWLAQSRSFPAWLVARWMGRMGFQEATAYCDAQNHIPPITVRTNPFRVGRDRLLEALKAACKEIRPCRYAPEGVSFFNPRTPISEMTAFKQGWFQVQDEAAQLVTLFLDPRPGERLLDACAGRGGKTGHIAQQMKNQGQIVALDMDGEKLYHLMAEMRRLGVAGVKAEKGDLQSAAGFDGPRRFDRVLLDAPCSGLGVLRRNPDARWRVTETDLLRHREKQLTMLAHASTMVKPSGVLVYAVCSTEPEENEDVVAAFLDAHPAFRLYSDVNGLPEPVRRLGSVGPYLRTSPLDHDMDGFFAARLERTR